MNLRLGLYQPNFPPTVTPLGITVYTCGLIDYGPKRIRKTCQRMIDAQVGDWIINQFRDWATALPETFCGTVDRIYTERLDAWRACVGRRLPNGKTISAATIAGVRPNSFTIRLHPEPWAPSGVLTAGASWSDRVEVVVAYLGSSEGQPNSWLRKCDDLLQWELGNLIGIRHGFSPRNVSEEIGNRSPCGL